MLDLEYKQQVIELFLCSNDNRLQVISDIVGCCHSHVSNIISDYYNGKIQFDRGNYRILHSSINSDE